MDAAARKALFTEIASKHTHGRITTLDERKRDALDFHEVSVWNLADMLEAAFRAGAASGSTKHGSRGLRRRLDRCVARCQSMAIGARLGELYARLEAGEVAHVRTELDRIEGRS